MTSISLKAMFYCTLLPELQRNTANLGVALLKLNDSLVKKKKQKKFVFLTIPTNASEKLKALTKAQELLLHSKKVLLDNFLNEMMGFQKDRSQEVRKFVVGFIELVCKKDPDLLPDVIVNLRMMIGDEVVVVQKRVIQVKSHLIM